MVHEQPCSAAAPWQDWLIETGPEELDGSDSGNGPEGAPRFGLIVCPGRKANARLDCMQTSRLQ